MKQAIFKVSVSELCRRLGLRNDLEITALQEVSGKEIWFKVQGPSVPDDIVQGGPGSPIEPCELNRLQD